MFLPFSSVSFVSVCGRYGSCSGGGAGLFPFFFRERAFLFPFFFPHFVGSSRKGCFVLWNAPDLAKAHPSLNPNHLPQLPTPKVFAQLVTCFGFRASFRWQTLSLSGPFHRAFCRLVTVHRAFLRQELVNRFFLGGRLSLNSPSHTSGRFFLCSKHPTVGDGIVLPCSSSLSTPKSIESPRRGGVRSPPYR